MTKEITVRIATAPECWGQDVTEDQARFLSDAYEDAIYRSLETRYPGADVTVRRDEYPIPGQRVRPEALEDELIAHLDDLFQSEDVWSVIR
jgi:hypothetical protein